MPDPTDLQLARRYGPFERASFYHSALSESFGDWVKRLVRRHGEVVLVVPRGSGRILLHTKPNYPEGVFRLPTGGIRPGEQVGRAARRESYEELGFKPKTLWLLGILDNVFVVNERTLTYPSYIFRTEEYSRIPKPTDPGEAISGFGDVNAAELRAVGWQLASLTGAWREWGAFRATSHLWLAERLNSKRMPQ